MTLPSHYELCELVACGNGFGYCPVCDPGRRRPLRQNALRNCPGKPKTPRPRHARPSGRRPQRATSGGPGTELHKLLSRLRIDTTEGCGCLSRIRQMDAWGVDGCRERLDEIAGWLVEEAGRRNWPASKWWATKQAAKVLVRWAIRRASKIQRNQNCDSR